MNMGSAVRALSSALGGAQLRRIGMLAVGTAAGQLAVLLAAPVLARIYSPADFGIYAYYVAALGFLAPVATLRYEHAIPLPESETDAIHVARASLAASVVLAALVAIGLAVGIETGLLQTRPDDLRTMRFVLPAGVLCAGVAQTLAYWAVRRERFAEVARFRAVLGTGVALLQIPFGLVSPIAAGLYSGDLAARGAALSALHRSALDVFRGRMAPWSGARLYRAATTYAGFATYSAPSSLINGSATVIPVFAVGYMYGPAAAGWLFMAQRIVGLPAAMLTTAASQVYVAEIARLNPAARLRAYRATLRRLAIVGGVPVLAAGAIAPLAFAAVFGPEWRTAGYLAAALAPLYGMQLLSGATITTLDVTQRHRTRMIREVLLLATVAGVFWAAYGLGWTLMSLTVVYGVAGTTFYAGSILLVHTVLSRGDQ